MGKNARQNQTTPGNTANSLLSVETSTSTAKKFARQSIFHRKSRMKSLSFRLTGERKQQRLSNDLPTSRLFDDVVQFCTKSAKTLRQN